jgi:hypothetical protein
MTMRFLMLGLVLLGTACSPTNASDVGSEASVDPALAKCWQRDNVSPVDGGYCCPIGPWSVGASGMCSDNTYAGGFAKNPGECCEQFGTADMPFTFGTDSHGCTVVVPSATGCCPICLYPPDASDAAAPMDASDAHSDASDAHGD